MNISPLRQGLAALLIASLLALLLLGAVCLSLAEAPTDSRAAGEPPLSPQTAFPFQAPAGAAPGAVPSLTAQP